MGATEAVPWEVAGLSSNCATRLKILQLIIQHSSTFLNLHYLTRAAHTTNMSLHNAQGNRCNSSRVKTLSPSLRLFSCIPFERSPRASHQRDATYHTSLASTPYSLSPGECASYTDTHTCSSRHAPMAGNQHMAASLGIPNRASL